MKRDFLFRGGPAHMGSAAVFMAMLGLGGCRSGIGISPNSPGMRDVQAMGAADPALDELEFMAGSWRSMDKDGLSEELWSVPHGNSIIGSFRMCGTDGALKLQEALAIVAQTDGVHMRLRHFDPKLIPREEKEAPITLKLESAAGQRAVFRCVSGSKSLATISYWRVEQTLHSAVAFTPDSKREPLLFEMRRLAAHPY